MVFVGFFFFFGGGGNVFVGVFLDLGRGTHRGHIASQETDSNIPVLGGTCGKHLTYTQLSHTSDCRYSVLYPQ